MHGHLNVKFTLDVLVKSLDIATDEKLLVKLRHEEVLKTPFWIV